MGRDTRVVRIVLIVAALLTGAWLATQVRAAHAENELTKIAFEGKDPGDARSLLAVDRFLNPDPRPDLFEGVILGRAGDFRGAVTAIQRVTRAEPESIEAWGLLASAAKRTDPRLAAQAAATARRLAPPVSRSN
jgi:Flp pilus assembly protein TadD